MSCTPDIKTEEPAQPDELARWQEILSLGDAEDGAEPLPGGDLAALVPACPSFVNADCASNQAESFSSAAGEERAAPPPPLGRPSRPGQTYTLEDANKVAALLRAAPAKDPNKRRMDKQSIVKRVVDEIGALQERGYTLEEVAELLSTGGLKLTLPTLKSYLSRARKASAKGVKKGPQRVAPPLVLTPGVR